jgi:hypothetical protein
VLEVFSLCLSSVSSSFNAQPDFQQNAAILNRKIIFGKRSHNESRHWARFKLPAGIKFLLTGPNIPVHPLTTFEPLLTTSRRCGRSALDPARPTLPEQLFLEVAKSSRSCAVAPRSSNRDLILTRSLTSLRPVLFDHFTYSHWHFSCSTGQFPRGLLPKMAKLE